jgi:hypothetical protein
VRSAETPTLAAVVANYPSLEINAAFNRPGEPGATSIFSARFSGTVRVGERKSPASFRLYDSDFVFRQLQRGSLRMSLQDAIRQLNAVSDSPATTRCKTTEEPPGQSNDGIETSEARRTYFRLKLLRKLEEGHLGSARQETR